MTSTLDATFGTRREAELVIERLVQAFGVDRSAIRVGPEGDENSAGERRSGGDAERLDEPSPDARPDAPLAGRIVISVALEHARDAEAIRRAFGEFGGERA